MNARAYGSLTAVSTPAFTSREGGLLLRKCVCGGTPGPTGACAECRRKQPPVRPFQTRLRIVQPGAGREQDAGRGAEQVVQGSNPSSTATVRGSGHQFGRMSVYSSGGHEAPLLTHSRFGKAEAAFDDRGPEDDEVKVENSNGGVPSAGIGAAIGDLARTVGHAAATVVSIATGVDINWPASNYTSDNTNGSSTTVERPFNVSYKAARDTTSNVWRLRVDSITGGANIHVRTGGSRDPVANPPTTEAQAQDAVTVMKGYYSRGSRGSWHTEAASKAHEEHHYQEWQCSGNHYWPTARTAVQSLSVPLSSHPDEAAAITAMRAGASGADAIIQSFRDVAHRYWFTLEDNASSRPYAAGQLVLNNAVRHVQTLATGKGWTVPGGVDTPSAANPCYQPWLPYSP